MTEFQKHEEMRKTLCMVHVTQPTKYIETNEIPAWDEYYTILPGQYVVVDRERDERRWGHGIIRWREVVVQAEIISVAKPALLCGRPMTNPPTRKGEVVELAINMKRLPLSILLESNEIEELQYEAEAQEAYATTAAESGLMTV